MQGVDRREQIRAAAGEKVGARRCSDAFPRWRRGSRIRRAVSEHSSVQVRPASVLSQTRPKRGSGALALPPQPVVPADGDQPRRVVGVEGAPRSTGELKFRSSSGPMPSRRSSKVFPPSSLTCGPLMVPTQTTSGSVGCHVRVAHLVADESEARFAPSPSAVGAQPDAEHVSEDEHPVGVVDARPDRGHATPAPGHRNGGPTQRLVRLPGGRDGAGQAHGHKEEDRVEARKQESIHGRVVRERGCSKRRSGGACTRWASVPPRVLQGH